MNGNAPRPKVLIMTPGILPVPAVRGGAVETLITDIIDENEKKKTMDITVVTISDPDILKDRYSHTRIVPVKKTALCNLLDRLIDKVQRTVRAGKAVRLFDRSLMSGLRAVADITDFDVIIIENMIGLAGAGVKEAEEKGSRAGIFVHLHNNIDMYRSPSGICKLAQKGVTFITVSGYIKNEVLKAAPEADVSVLYNGIDTGLMDRSLRDKREILREQYRIPVTSTVILYSGRIIAEKGVYELIHGFALWKMSRPESDMFLVLAGGGVGDGGRLTGYEKKIQAEIMEIPDSIRLIGKVPYRKIPEVYAAADVLAVPTLDEEPFGMVVLEGMAMGLPIITTATGGIPEILEDGKGCIKITKDNILGDLADAFDRIGSEGFRDTLNDMGAHNLKICMNKADVSKEGYYDRFLFAIGLKTEGIQ